ncbi:MAG: NAD(P)H-dependent oxidoreductase subunit E [Thermoanaerobaculia bacterium]|jgi:NADH-quinone oxidoreductase subunit E|nr:NAD(P)H-dependent oxidoreductase subunit E [Thermoanaerobaculia bacterium]MBP9824116.1 NAD(P)H-dependent oxidoreductase subunit E [Thermoanaerobaculia bacterium]
MSSGRRAASESLPESAIEEILALRPKYPTLEALTLPALHIAQRANGGWLPEAAIEAVAHLLELPVARVAGVVSFYDMYHVRPVGRHRIRVCTNLSCQLRGSGEILETIGQELGVSEGQVTADGRCSYVQFECLGSCDTAPMVMIDDDYHENLTPDRVRQIVRELK